MQKRASLELFRLIISCLQSNIKYHRRSKIFLRKITHHQFLFDRTSGPILKLLATDTAAGATSADTSTTAILRHFRIFRVNWFENKKQFRKHEKNFKALHRKEKKPRWINSNWDEEVNSSGEHFVRRKDRKSWTLCFTLSSLSFERRKEIRRGRHESIFLLVWFIFRKIWMISMNFLTQASSTPRATFFAFIKRTRYCDSGCPRKTAGSGRTESITLVAANAHRNIHLNPRTTAGILRTTLATPSLPSSCHVNFDHTFRLTRNRLY